MASFSRPRRHRYRIVVDVPVMLLDDVSSTHGACARSLSRAWSQANDTDAPCRDSRVSNLIDPFVQQAVAATNGYLYKPLIGKLSRYPIPQLRLPDAAGSVFLDIGCSWGRWCSSAARRGYRPVGIDPSLDAIQSARKSEPSTRRMRNILLPMGDIFRWRLPALTSCSPTVCSSTSASRMLWLACVKSAAC